MVVLFAYPTAPADEAEKTALAFDRAPAFGLGHAQILRGFVMPWVHSECLDAGVIVSRG